ncbi:MAG: hypothetical protein KAR20_10365, partial [Candidatus Heimdallarchaeota archaeon]|nr:hypothetical protein [Candidatus Heimdallarchaeota archaeon]
MSDTVLKKLFQVFVNKLEFDPFEFLIPDELTDFQKKMIDSATSIMKENIVGEVKSFGGNVKANEDKFKELEDKAKDELENEEYDDLKKELKNYIKKLKEIIEKTCVAIIPVKEMPWVDVIFRTVPRVIFDKKIELLDNAIAYYGEIKCLISRPTVFGKMEGEKPLFAPIMGSVDLGGYKLDETQKEPKSQIHSYVSAIIESLDSIMTRNHLAKYHEAYQRHGDPICDFLMKDDELMNSMEKITTGIESSRISSEIAVCSIALPLTSDKTTLLIVVDEADDPTHFTTCFEAFLRFSAEGCNVPSISTSSQSLQPPGQVAGQQPGVVRTPGGQELKVWTAEELTSEAQKRMTSQPDMPAWTEEELKKFTEERGTGLPEGMEMWTEEDLQELARKRQGGLDIPEWEPDSDMKECAKCGYALRPGWSKCPLCETPVGVTVESDSEEPEASEESQEPSSEIKEEIPLDEPEEEKEEEE